MNSILHPPASAGSGAARDAAYPLAPPIAASEWLNVNGAADSAAERAADRSVGRNANTHDRAHDQPLSLAAFHGRVVVLHFFQMLCPGCAAHGIPQTVEIQCAFDPKKVAVIGVHSVFEHHDVMTPEALRVFVHEYRLTFPIAIDRPANDSVRIPLTMRAYGLQGTPSLILIDAEGRLRAHHFGQVSDLQVGAEIGQLLAEAKV